MVFIAVAKVVCLCGIIHIVQLKECLYCSKWNCVNGGVSRATGDIDL